jgi:hypothetical protein
VYSTYRAAPVRPLRRQNAPGHPTSCRGLTELTAIAQLQTDFVSHRPIPDRGFANRKSADPAINVADSCD